MKRNAREMSKSWEQKLFSPEAAPFRIVSQDVRQQYQDQYNTQEQVKTAVIKSFEHPISEGSGSYVLVQRKQKTDVRSANTGVVGLPVQEGQPDGPLHNRQS